MRTENHSLRYDFDEAYGNRPRHDAVFYLNAWEFTMYWNVCEMQRGRSYQSDTTEACPKYLRFPDEPSLHPKFQRLVLMRRLRPCMPAPESTPMPTQEKDPETKAKLLSIYLRPWTLLETFACKDVPLLQMLDIYTLQQSIRRRLRGKQEPYVKSRSFQRTWRHYIRGNVVSLHAARIITQFMAANAGGSQTRDTGETDISAHEKKDGDFHASNNVSVNKLHDILRNMASHVLQTSPEDAETSSRSKKKINQHRAATNTAMQIGDQLWGLETSSWRNQVAHRPSVAAQVDAESPATKRAPPVQKGTPEPHVYTKFRFRSAQKWLWDLKDPTPNQAQSRFLQSIINRCAVEQREFHTAVPPLQTSEPMQACLLAPPGTGKTQCFLWLIDLFENILGWTMGTEFQMTAPQNTMAAAIHGSTNHSWGEVPIDLDNPDARQTRKNKAGISTLFLKCLNQRWLCIDEISTSSLLVLGIMESNLRKACKRHLHALDKDGSPRSWGGLNLVTGGDWNQLPAVKAKSIFRNPFSRDLVGPEKRISHLFWGLDDEFLPNNRDYLFELTEQNRSRDVWLNAMLAQDRVGQENYAVWCFCHGLPTTKVGSWLPG